MDGVSLSKHEKPVDPRSPRKRRTVCLAVIAGFVGLVLLLVILGLTVFKAKRPVTTVDSVALEDVDVSLDLPRVKVYLNVSLGLNLRVKNPNKVGMKYRNSSAFMYYRGQLVGEAPIPAGKISSDETKKLNISLTILADRLLSNSDVYSDVASGGLTFTTTTRISGKVHILKLFKVHVVSDSSCDVVVHVSNRTLSDFNCKYKTKL